MKNHFSKCIICALIFSCVLLVSSCGKKAREYEISMENGSLVKVKTSPETKLGMLDYMEISFETEESLLEGELKRLGLIGETAQIRQMTLIGSELWLYTDQTPGFMVYRDDGEGQDRSRLKLEPGNTLHWGMSSSIEYLLSFSIQLEEEKYGEYPIMAVGTAKYQCIYEEDGKEKQCVLQVKAIADEASLNYTP